MSSTPTTRPPSKEKAHFIPPPIGLQVVSLPPPGLFERFLSGAISPLEMLGGKKKIELSREQTREQISSTPARKNSFFNLIAQIKQIQSTPKKMKIIRNANSLKNLSKEVTHVSSRFRKYEKSTTSLLKSQNLMHQSSQAKITISSSEEQFIRRCEKQAGEKLTQEEIELLLKHNLSQKDAWQLMNRFNNKKWFFEYISRNKGAQSPMRKEKPQQKGLLNKVRNLIVQPPQTTRKIEEQGQLYYAGIKQVEESLRQRLFYARQKRCASQENIKTYRADAVCERLRLRDNFIKTTRQHSQGTDQNIVYEFKEPQQLTERPKTRVRKQEQISRQTDSHASQNDSFQSMTEFKLNEFYELSRQRQKKLVKDSKGPEDALGIQKRVKHVVKLGNLCNSILKVVENKLNPS